MRGELEATLAKLPDQIGILRARARISRDRHRQRVAIDEIEQALKGMLKPEYEEVALGRAEVREVFRSSKIGAIAGCMVTSGEIRRNAKARLLRDNVVVREDFTVSSLRRFKDDVTEVREGFECGIGVGYNDIKVEDVIETFEMREKPRA